VETLTALLDTNVLVHAVYRGSPLHEPAAELLDRGLRQRGLYCIAPQNLVEFASVVTRPRLVSPPLPPSDVLRISDLLYGSRRLSKIYPRRATVMRALRHGARAGLSGPRWYDLFLAFTMVDAGVEVIITDDVKHFAQFQFLTVHNIQGAI
jgi:predicted nucleic acid-binding protein